MPLNPQKKAINKSRCGNYATACTYNLIDMIIEENNYFYVNVYAKIGLE